MKHTICWPAASLCPWCNGRGALSAFDSVAGIPTAHLQVSDCLVGLLVHLCQIKCPRTINDFVLVETALGETWHAIQSYPRELDGKTPEQIRRTGQLRAGEGLEWHSEIPLIVFGHGNTMDFPSPLVVKGAQIEANFLAADKDLPFRSSHGQSGPPSRAATSFSRWARARQQVDPRRLVSDLGSGDLIDRSGQCIQMRNKVVEVGYVGRTQKPVVNNVCP
jgi:hypothetical protein